MNFITRTNLQNDILLILVGFVGAFGALVMVYSVFFGFRENLVTNENNLTVKKSQILAMVQSKNLLTKSEKDIIGRELIGERIKMYSFTDREINKILEALNKN